MDRALTRLVIWVE